MHEVLAEQETLHPIESGRAGEREVGRGFDAPSTVRTSIARHSPRRYDINSGKGLPGFQSMLKTKRRERWISHSSSPVSFFS